LRDANEATVPAMLDAANKVGLDPLVFVGVLLLITSPSSKEVGKVPVDSKGLIEIEEAEHLVSVTVVLSVTVTIEAR
jgi:hypothetical protein